MLWFQQVHPPTQLSPVKVTGREASRRCEQKICHSTKWVTATYAQSANCTGLSPDLGSYSQQVPHVQASFPHRVLLHFPCRMQPLLKVPPSRSSLPVISTTTIRTSTIYLLPLPPLSISRFAYQSASSAGLAAAAAAPVSHPSLPV